MNRSRSEFDVLEKITQERLSRGWTEYTLAKNAEIPQSTISTWYRKNLQPSVSSIEKICKGLDITLSAFFSDGQKDSSLTEAQQELLELWQYLSPDQKQAIIYLLKSFCNIKAPTEDSKA